MSQQDRPDRAGAVGSPVVKGWLIGTVGVVVAILLGWILIGIGSAKLRKAEEIRVAAENNLEVAVSSAAEDAMAELRQARLAVNNRNWGSAQTNLMKVDARVRLIQQLAPQRSRREAEQVRQLMDDVLAAASAQAEDTPQKVDALEAALDGMKQKAGAT
ncbi:MAG: hypothetical protein ACE149_02870 [Armatimonadota bacterium]